MRNIIVIQISHEMHELQGSENGCQLFLNANFSSAYRMIVVLNVQQ